MRIIPVIFAFTLICAPLLAVDFPMGVKPLSSSGLIQNVGSYSSNPFYNPFGPYNQIPVPTTVYATGPSVETSDCQTIVGGIVASQCARRNNCIGAKIDDIRPAVVLQLSQMSGANYMGNCGGFIDGAFNDYVKNFGGGGTPFVNQIAPFPTPQTAIQSDPYNLGAKFNAPKATTAKDRRKAEMEALQKQTAPDITLRATDFPTTIYDVSFEDRIANAAAGYEQWACDPTTGKNCAYQQMKDIETDEEALARMKREEQARVEYCKTHLAAYGYDVIDGDLVVLQNCLKNRTPFATCKSMLKGAY